MTQTYNEIRNLQHLNLQGATPLLWSTKVYTPPKSTNISLKSPPQETYHLTYYRSLIAGSAQNNSKNKCLKFWNIIGIFAEYNNIIFQNCQKVRNFYFSLEFYL